MGDTNDNVGKYGIGPAHWLSGFIGVFRSETSTYAFLIVNSDEPMPYLIPSSPSNPSTFFSSQLVNKCQFHAANPRASGNMQSSCKMFVALRCSGYPTIA